MRSALLGPHRDDGDRTAVDIGIGVGMIDQHCGDAAAVLHSATTALRQARPTASGTHILYRAQPTGPRPSTTVVLWHRPDP